MTYLQVSEKQPRTASWLHQAIATGISTSGAHLYEALGERAAIVGVAKTRFVGAEPVVLVTQGGSRIPLFVTAAGMDVAEAASHIRAMHRRLHAGWAGVRQPTALPGALFREQLAGDRPHRPQHHVQRPGSELCRDPEPEEDHEIRAWVRHDVYLGLASGAKGVLIWSLFKRPAVRRTWQLWYDAYSECGRELNGELGLFQVFLFGERATTLTVQPTKAPPAETVTVGGDVEATTTSEQERQQREIEVPSWTAAEFVYDGSHWLWLINSANTDATFQLSGWPNQPRVRDAFTGKEIDVDAGSPWELTRQR